MTASSKSVPRALRGALIVGKGFLRDSWHRAHLACLRWKLVERGLPVPRQERLFGYTIQVNDNLNYYTLMRNIFLDRIYHFDAARRDPLILDCGSNIGMSILYFKRIYPHCRVVGFEPDPVVFRYLSENIASNHVTGVDLVQGALAAKDRTATLFSDGKEGSTVGSHASIDAARGRARYEVPCVRLREHLTSTVDFLKMNIEGSEWEVLADSEDRLGQVREMVIEYHHLPGLPRTLHRILDLLARNGFEYLINDFDAEANHDVHPPFHLAPSTRYFLLLYARRRDEAAR